MDEQLACHDSRVQRDSRLLVDTLDDVVAKMHDIPDRALINLQQDLSFKVSQNVMKLDRIVNKYKVLLHWRKP